MKKYLLTAAFAAMSLFASAQGIWVGGALSYQNVNPKVGDASNVITLAPEVGYMFNDKFGVGLELNDQLCFGAQEGNLFGANLFGRWNFAQVEDKLTFFLDGGFGIQGASDKAKVWADDHWSIGIKPGVKYNLTDQWALLAKTGMIGYTKVKGGPGVFDFGVDGRNLSFGIQYSF